MNNSVFTQSEFWLLVLFSTVLPFAIYRWLWARRSVSPAALMSFAVCLVVLAGLDVYLLQWLRRAALGTAWLVDDAIFASELSTALYLLPALFGGIGINIASHVLIRHFEPAEKRFERAHRGE